MNRKAGSRKGSLAVSRKSDGHRALAVRLRVPEREWLWFGDAGHFICGAECRFHMATQIGGVLVSTVGRYFPRHKPEEAVPKDGEEIGCDRTYETMAFNVTGRLCECGCGIPKIIPTEIEFDAYNDAKSARLGHMAICRKVAARAPVRSKRP